MYAVVSGSVGSRLHCVDDLRVAFVRASVARVQPVELSACFRMSSSSSSVKRDAASSSSRKRTRSAAGNKYVDGGDRLYFKSSRSNGLAFLSNFWPSSVSESAVKAVKQWCRGDGDDDDDEAVMPETTAFQLPREVSLVDIADGAEPVLLPIHWRFPSAEHAFQALKWWCSARKLEMRLEDEALSWSKEEMQEAVKALDAAADAILAAETSLEAKKLNTVHRNRRKRRLGVDIELWNAGLRVQVMRAVLAGKFAAVTKAAAQLTRTHPSWLGEVPRTPDYWNAHERGGNMLGKLLMETRQKLLEDQHEACTEPIRK